MDREKPIKNNITVGHNLNVGKDFIAGDKHIYRNLLPGEPIAIHETAREPEQNNDLQNEDKWYPISALASLLVFILLLLWFFKDPSYEPLVSLVTVTAAAIGLAPIKNRHLKIKIFIILLIGECILGLSFIP